MSIPIQFAVTVHLPAQDLDLVSADHNLARILQDRLEGLIPHYRPTVEQTTKSWQINNHLKGSAR